MVSLGIATFRHQEFKSSLDILNCVSPGLVVMGGELCSKGCGFESWRHIMDGHNIFSHKFVVRIVMFV